MNKFWFILLSLSTFLIVSKANIIQNHAGSNVQKNARNIEKIIHQISTPRLISELVLIWSMAMWMAKIVAIATFVGPIWKRRNEAKWKEIDSLPPIMQSVYYGDIKGAESLIRSGANVNVKNTKGETPLYIAAVKASNERDLVDELVSSIDFAGKPGTEERIREEANKVAELLIRNGANVNTRTNDGKTALMCAKSSGNTKLVELLIRHGAKQ